MAWVMKVAIWGLKIGDPVPPNDLDHLRNHAPEAIEEIEDPKKDEPVEEKAASSPKNKMVFGSYRNKKG